MFLTSCSIWPSCEPEAVSGVSFELNILTKLERFKFANIPSSFSAATNEFVGKTSLGSLRNKASSFSYVSLISLMSLVGICPYCQLPS